MRLDLVLQLGHFISGFVGIVGGDLVVAVHQRLLRRHAFHHIAAHILGSVELRLLRQIPCAHAVGGPGIAGEVLVQSGHDAHQGGLASAIDADNADLGPRVEAEPDVFQHLLAAGVGLAETLHHIDELGPGHLIVILT